MLTVHGLLSASGTAEDSISKTITGIAGMGHILLSAGMVLLFLALRTRIFAPGTAGEKTGGANAVQVTAVEA